MRAHVLAGVVAAVFPWLALGDFEGVLDSKMSGENTNGSMRTWISKVGVRNEMDVQSPEAEKAGMGKSFRMVTLVKAAQPDVTYLLDDNRKTYSVLEHKPGTYKSDETFTAKRIGKDTVAGFACDQVNVTSSRGHELEMCVARDMIGGSAWIRAFQQRAEDQGHGLMKALSDAGVKGLPIRWVSKGKDGHGPFRVELVSARRQPVPASTFEIPAGYTKSEVAMPAMSPEMAKKMDEAMKRQQEALEKMSPEQRKQMEEMMKKFGAGAR